ncbi:MAG: GGDEF domain-containing protein, partial [Rhizobiales bacterium]|nr:GGDEF domain-containing protein [Hyphomicrobiales bacterium]
CPERSINDMSGASFALAVNASLALLVAAAFLGLARTAATPGVRWFAASYAIGAGTPISELLVRFAPVSAPFVASSFATFSLAFHVMAAGLSRYYGVALPRWLLPASFTLSLLGRALLWEAPRGVFLFELFYQLPFTMALAICTAILVIGAPRRLFDIVLTAAFGLAAAHFLVKPFLSVMVGSGPTARDYILSRYALISQSMTAIVLIGVALSLILVVVRDMLEDTRRGADLDGLSGLPNRRAFDRDASAALRDLSAAGHTAAMVMFDLDRFKAINDAHGHAVGDQVIRAFASALQRAAPDGTMLARIGGEEFAALIPDGRSETAEAMIARTRSAFGSALFSGRDGPFRASASCGVAWTKPSETLHEVMVRCDHALYRAKAEGRDRTAVAG